MDDLGRAMRRVETESDVTRAVRWADQLADVRAVVDGEPQALRLLGDVLRGGDELAAVAAVHALTRAPGPDVDRVLTESLVDARAVVRTHAAWALSGRSPVHDAVGGLVHLVTGGGFAGMIAQRTLIGWGEPGSPPIEAALLRALDDAVETTARRLLAEALGELPGAACTATLRRLAADPHEARDVRAAAIAAIGDRREPGVFELLTSIAESGDEPLDAVALLALDDLTFGPGAVVASGHGRGLRVGQLYLHAELDDALSAAGAGDGGGVATLLVSLRRALAAHESVEDVLTIGRGTPDAALLSLLELGARRHVLAAVPLGPIDGPPPALPAAWSWRVQAERHLRRLLRRRPPLDVLHLRMADVGTLAASRAARRLGVPIAFSVAPDPHTVVRDDQHAGRLVRSEFGAADEQEHLWFRMRMVERLVRWSRRLALFPRPELDRELRDLLGLDLAAHDDGRPTAAVVPEGIDLQGVLDAEGDVLGGDPPVVGELRTRIAAMPRSRRGLPLALVVARLHPVKGVPRVVGAWAGDAWLRSTCNLVIVGGELTAPNAVERRVLDEIAVAAGGAGGRDGLVLLGRRSHADTLRLMSLAVHGTRHGAPDIGGGGVLVNGSSKEEFGLAMVEALAAGLVVVGPAVGAPLLYVERGVTGVLASPTEDLAASMRAAFGLVARPGRAARARRLVRGRYTVDAMAASLVDLYLGDPTVART